MTPVQREMVTLSCLIVMNREVQLKRHLSNALNVGLTPEQIVELIIHDTWYSGAPADIQALTLCKAVFEERGIDFTPARIHDASEDPDSLFQRGDEYRRNYMGTASPARPTPPTQAERVGPHHRRVLLGCDLDADRAGPSLPLHLHHVVPGGAGP